VITLLVAVTVAGLVTGRLVRRTMTTMQDRRAAQLPVPGREGPKRAEERRATEDDRQKGLPCALGDVVLLAGGEEAWLAGAVLFRERAAHRDESGEVTRTVAALFVAPESGRDRAVYARSSPEVSLDWMAPLAPAALTLGGEPPSAIEHDGERFERVRRVPLALECVGAGAPDLGARGVVGEYEGGGGARLLVVIGASGTRAWRGRRLDQGMYEILPGKRDRDAG